MKADTGPFLALFDRDGNVRAKLSVVRGGIPDLELVDRDGTPRVTLTVRYDGTADIRIFDRNGEVIWKSS